MPGVREGGGCVSDRPTPRQLAALEAVLRYGSQEAAGRRLRTTELAVKLRLRRLRHRLDVETNEQAVYICRANEWLVVEWLEQK